MFEFLILRVYVRLFISRSCFVSECLYHCPAILWLIVAAYTCLLSFSYSLSLWISVLAFGGYSVTHGCVYVRFFFLIGCVYVPVFLSLTFCLWMCIPVSEYIIIQSWCISTSFDPCFYHSFSMIVYVCIRLYCHWQYVYRYVSYSAFSSISLYLCLSQCPGIASVICMYVNKRIQLGQCVRTLSKMCVCITIIINTACIRTSLDSYLCLSLWLWMSAPVSGYVSLFLSVCLGVRLYYQ